MAARLQLGWTALQPVPPASPALLCRVLCWMEGCGVQGSPGGAGKGLLRVLGGMRLLLTPGITAGGAGAA